MGVRGAFGVLIGTLLWLAPPALPALAQTAPDPAPPAQQQDAARTLCDAQTPRERPLTEDEASACRALWQADVAAASARHDAYLQDAIDAAAARKNRQKAKGPVPLSTFVGDDTLTYGDIVMVDEGPRVYVGRAYEQAKAEDFLTLDAPRSPHRKRAKEMLRALRQ